MIYHIYSYINYRYITNKLLRSQKQCLNMSDIADRHDSMIFLCMIWFCVTENAGVCRNQQHINNLQYDFS